MRKLAAITLGLALFCSSQIYAQAIPRHFTVTFGGGPLVGATVHNVTTGASTYTNSNGKASILASSGDVVTVSYIGLVTQQVTIDSRIEYSVELAAAKKLSAQILFYKVDIRNVLAKGKRSNLVYLSSYRESELTPAVG